MSKYKSFLEKIAKKRELLRKEKEREVEEIGTLKEQYANLWFAYKFIFQANKKLFFVRLPLLLLRTAQTIIPIFFVRAVLNELTNGQSVIRVVVYALSMAVNVFLIKLIISRFTIWDAYERENLGFKVRTILADAAMEMSYSTLEDPKMQNYMWLAKHNRFDNILKYTTNLMEAIINIIAIGATVLSLNPIIFVVITISSTIKFFVGRLRRKYPYRYNDDRVAASRVNEYYVKLMSEIATGKEVRVNNLENWIDDKVETSWKMDLLPLDKKFKRTMLNLQGIDGVIGMIQEILIYFILAIEVLHSSMTIGDFSMYLTAAGTFSGAVMRISESYSTLMVQAAWYLREYRRCLSVSAKQKETDGLKHLDTLGENAEIEFRNVYFKYPHTEKMILENINLIIRKGESLSIVGENGAGKTTFVKLLCRLYEPTEGEIFINGISTKDIPLEEYYMLLGVVFQDFKLFSFTARENIVMNTICDDSRLYESIKKCGLEKRIEQLPHGVDTYINKEFDSNGIELSGGEGQKIAIARSIYRDTPIVVFDEPTSSLDPIAEYEIYKNFHNLAQKRTSIYISHRMSSTRFTDKIVVLKNGIIAEYGTHDELMKIDCGIYKEMFSIQAKYYQE